MQCGVLDIDNKELWYWFTCSLCLSIVLSILCSKESPSQAHQYYFKNVKLKRKGWTDKMVQWVKILVDEPGDLSLIFGTYMV